MNINDLKYIIREEVKKLKERKGTKGCKCPNGTYSIKCCGQNDPTNPNPPSRPGAAGGRGPTAGGGRCPYAGGGTFQVGDQSMTLTAQEAMGACEEWSTATNNGTNRGCWSLCQWIGCADHPNYEFSYNCDPCHGCVSQYHGLGGVPR